MQYSLSRFALILCLGGALAACGSTPKQDESKSPPNQLPSSGQTAPADGSQGADGKPLQGDAAGVPTDRVVYFDYDRSEIRDQDRALLEQHGRYLSANPNATVRLEGHADERGSREYNLALGERRAQAVSRSLSILGARDGQLTTSSYGEEKPVKAGHDEGSWQQNRRVEFSYSGG